MSIQISIISLLQVQLLPSYCC